MIKLFYERLSELCAERQKTVSAFLKEIGVSTSKVTYWKTAPPKADTLNRIADYFNVSVDYLLGNTTTKKAVTNKDDDLTEFQKSMLLSVKNFSQEDQAKVLDYIRLLKMQREK
jgi:transcriptional regulator with XRE-family HTH domain